MNWTLEVDRGERFISSDAPEVVRRKPTSMDDSEGVGIDTADELRFPLDPSKQIVLSKRKRPRLLTGEPHRVRR